MDDTSILAAVVVSADGRARLRPRPGLFADAGAEKVQTFADNDGVHSWISLPARYGIHAVLLPRAVG